MSAAHTHPYCVGLTGGVGCGKSTVAAMFARRGVAIIDTDDIARELTARGGGALPAIVAEFGDQMLDATGALDRGAMRARVFADSDARRRLQHILHPAIRDLAAQRLGAVEQAPYVLLVVPLLAENLPAYRPMLDRILVVDCAPAQQLARTAARPGVGEAQARAIIAAQADPTVRRAIADDIIENDGRPEDLDARVAALHRRYRRLAAEHARNISATP